MLLYAYVTRIDIMQRTPKTRCTPSTIVLVSNLDACELTIRHTLAESPKCALADDPQCIVEVISKLKVQSDEYSEANRALIRRKRELSYSNEVDELVT